MSDANPNRKLLLYLVERQMELEIQIKALFRLLEEKSVSPADIERHLGQQRQAQISILEQAKQLHNTALNEELRRLYEEFEDNDQ